jgi:hypothetical protein
VADLIEPGAWAGRIQVPDLPDPPDLPGSLPDLC